MCVLHCRQFPRVGAYWACALKGSGDRVAAILAADSLMPPGSGRPLSEQDRLPAVIVSHIICSGVPVFKTLIVLVMLPSTAMRQGPQVDVSMSSLFSLSLLPLHHILGSLIFSSRIVEPCAASEV